MVALAGQRMPPNWRDLDAQPLASRLRFEGSTAMKRLAALLIVLTMTGSPVAHAACLAWCSSGTLATSEACHHSFTHALPAAMSGETNTCTAFLSTSAFFTLEPRAAIHPPVAMLPPEQGALVNASLPAAAAGRTPATLDRPAPVRVLRL